MENTVKKATKAEISRVVGDRLGANYRDSQRITNVFFDVMTDVLSEGRNIEIRNFGSFKVRSYGTRPARNPKTGEPVMIPERTKVLFKAGKLLRKEIDHAP